VLFDQLPKVYHSFLSGTGGGEGKGEGTRRRMFVLSFMLV